jgi:hypothetical protein
MVKLKMVAYEGAAPSISGCKPDVMLFHQQAESVMKLGSSEFEIPCWIFDIPSLGGRVE